MGNLLKDVRKDFDSAEQMYCRAIELDPQNAHAHMSLSKVLEHKGDIRGAIQATEGYIRAANPDNDGEERLQMLRERVLQTGQDHAAGARDRRIQVLARRSWNVSWRRR